MGLSYTGLKFFKEIANMSLKLLLTAVVNYWSRVIGKVPDEVSVEEATAAATSGTSSAFTSRSAKKIFASPERGTTHVRNFLSAVSWW